MRERNDKSLNENHKSGPEDLARAAAFFSLLITIDKRLKKQALHNESSSQSSQVIRNHLETNKKAINGNN